MCSTQSTICAWSPQAIIVGDCECLLITPEALSPSSPLFLSLAALLSFHPFYEVLSPYSHIIRKRNLEMVFEIMCPNHKQKNKQTSKHAKGEIFISLYNCIKIHTCLQYFWISRLASCGVQQRLSSDILHSIFIISKQSRFTGKAARAIGRNSLIP